MRMWEASLFSKGIVSSSTVFPRDTWTHDHVTKKIVVGKTYFSEPSIRLRRALDFHLYNFFCRQLLVNLIQESKRTLTLCCPLVRLHLKWIMEAFRRKNTAGKQFAFGQSFSIKPAINHFSCSASFGYNFCPQKKSLRWMDVAHFMVRLQGEHNRKPCLLTSL